MQKGDLQASSGGELDVKRKSDLWLVIFLSLHLLWIQMTSLCGRFYLSFVFGGTVNKRIVVIGDDNAVGVGDWTMLLSYPGLHRRFNEQIGRESPKGVKWTAHNFAKSGSTTENWLPGGIKIVGKDRHKCLFDCCFDKYIGAYADAAIVCIFLGSRDRCEPADTVANLKIICMELLRRGKYVLVATLPMSPRVAAHAEANRRFTLRNQLIEAMIASVHADQHTVSGFTGLYAIPLGRMAFDDRMFRFGERFLSGQGYSRCATVFMDQLTQVMRSIEYKGMIPKAYKMGSAFQ